MDGSSTPARTNRKSNCSWAYFLFANYCTCSTNRPLNLALSLAAEAPRKLMQKLLNLKIKYRESLRRFAPIVFREDVESRFEIGIDSPYMLLVVDVVKEKRIQMTGAQEALFVIEKLNIPHSEIPVVTHIDYSERIQTVHPKPNPRYYKLIKRFKELKGCPVIINTSFNIRGEPIVLIPEDAFRCLIKTDQNKQLAMNYINKYELD